MVRAADWVACTAGVYFLTVREAGSPRSSRLQIWSGEGFLVCRWLSPCHVLTWPSAESGNQLFLSCKGTKAVVRAPHSWPKDLPKVPPPDTIHGGLRFQHMGLGLGGAGRSIQSVAQTLRPSFARRVFSGKRPVGLGKCPVTRISRCGVIWNSFPVLKTLCAPPVF